MKAWKGTREASKCWDNEVADTLIKEGCKAVVVVVVSLMFVSENHGYVTVCHGDDFVSSGSAAASDEVDRVLTTHLLQVVRVARYVLQHPGETWLFNYQADPKSLYVYTDTDRQRTS